ncbi:MAG: gliding motility-associated C-terminal domain-containing protein [Flavicella sp.]
MKFRILHFIFSFIMIVTSPSCEKMSENSLVKEKHKDFIMNSPFKETIQLSKNDRKALALPPNKYYERMWELTMNPATGRPEPAKALALQKKLRQKRLLNKSPGDGEKNPWIERGPNNIAGRTRVLLFDPNDPLHKKVFAGGVSGGLWFNDDITDSKSPWNQVTGVPGNMNVSCITVDPRDSNIWYVGTGEQYTAGDVVGNGVYKSEDGGENWNNVSLEAMGIDNDTDSSLFLSGIYYVNDIIAWDNGTSTDIFVAVGGYLYYSANDPDNWLGLQSAGLYKSKDNGATWNRIESDNMSFNFGGGKFYYTPNDLEIAADNSLWMGTISSPIRGKGAGLVYGSSDGITWSLKASLPNSDRVEIAVSLSNSNKIYALTEGTDDVPHIYRTLNAFENFQEISKPNDVDEGIPADDFTRRQGFYNLVIEIDPIDDSILYVGGIDLFRSTDSGDSWQQISKRSTRIQGPFSTVHADQHVMVFRPDANNEAVFGNDGGVYYCKSLSDASQTSNIKAVNRGLNITQFYKGAISPNASDEYFLAGSQDNGTQFFNNPKTNEPDESYDISGGDGGYCFIDQVEESYLIVSYTYNQAISLYDFEAQEWKTVVSDNEDGDFINQSDLDSNLDILYTNGSQKFNNIYRLYRFSDLDDILPNDVATQYILEDPLLTSSPTALKVSPYETDTSLLFVGTETGELLKVTNADTDPIWEDISGSNFVGSISDIEFGNPPDEIMVTFHNYGVKSIWFSENGGKTWISKEGNFPDIPVKAILKNPILEDEVIVGTDLGVWKTEDWSTASPNWIQTYNGMSDVKVTDLQYKKDSRAVYATTYGRGIFSGYFEASAYEIKIPKAFTPNGDGVNDYWKINSLFEFYPNNSLKLYNSAGELVYSKNPFLDSFDGFSNVGTRGKLPKGSYMYVLKTGKPKNPQFTSEIEKKGWVYITY